MLRRPPRSTRTATRVPYPTLFRSLHTGVAFSGAVTQPDQYVGRAPNVVADFLDGFFGNGGNTLIRRRTEGLQKQVVPYVKQELARNSIAVVAIIAFHQQVITVLGRDRKRTRLNSSH